MTSTSDVELTNVAAAGGAGPDPSTTTPLTSGRRASKVSFGASFSRQIHGDDDEPSRASKKMLDETNQISHLKSADTNGSPPNSQPSAGDDDDEEFAALAVGKGGANIFMRQLFRIPLLARMTIVAMIPICCAIGFAVVLVQNHAADISEAESTAEFVEFVRHGYPICIEIQKEREVSYRVGVAFYPGVIEDYLAQQHASDAAIDALRVHLSEFSSPDLLHSEPYKALLQNLDGLSAMRSYFLSDYSNTTKLIEIVAAYASLIENIFEVVEAGHASVHMPENKDALRSMSYALRMLYFLDGERNYGGAFILNIVERENTYLNIYVSNTASAKSLLKSLKSFSTVGGQTFRRHETANLVQLEQTVAEHENILMYYNTTDFPNYFTFYSTFQQLMHEYEQITYAILDQVISDSETAKSDGQRSYASIVVAVSVISAACFALIAMLIVSVNHTNKIVRDEMTLRKVTENTTRRYVPEDLMALLNRTDVCDLRRGDRNSLQITVLFCNVRGMDKVVQECGSQHAYEWLTTLVSGLIPIVRANGGFVDKMLSDGLMAIFPKSPADAVKAAVEMQLKAIDLNGGRPTQNGDSSTHRGQASPHSDASGGGGRRHPLQRRNSSGRGNDGVGTPLSRTGSFGSDGYRHDSGSKSSVVTSDDGIGSVGCGDFDDITGGFRYEVQCGIHSGTAVIGIIGDRHRYEGTVVSDTVNTASRVCGMCKYYGSGIMVSEATLKAAGVSVALLSSSADPDDPLLPRPDFVVDEDCYSSPATPRSPSEDMRISMEVGAAGVQEWMGCIRPVGRILMKGKTNPVSMWEVFAHDDASVVAGKKRTRQAMDEILSQYIRGALVECRKLIEAVRSENAFVARKKGEGSSAFTDLALERRVVFLEELERSGIPDGWNGVDVFSTK